MKWADYCISKISIGENTKSISGAFVHLDGDETIGEGIIRNRNWLVQQMGNGKTFCCIDKTTTGQWKKVCDFTFENGSFKWFATLPKVLTNHKTFVSFYHKDDQKYREKFEGLFGDMIVHKSVDDGDIDSDTSDQYIKQLIQKDYLADTTVLVVLIGPNTKHRKHIDWEISGALNLKVGDKCAGVLALKLPTHPNYSTGKHTPSELPGRISDNLKSDFAIIRDWTENRVKMQEYIEEAFSRRDTHYDNRNNSRIQMTKNTNE